MLVPMRYVTRRRNADGSVRYYWQRPGHLLIRLPDDATLRSKRAAELNIDADAGRSGIASRSEPGTIGWALGRLRRSDWWADLSTSTKLAYERWIIAIDDTIGHEPLGGLSRKVVKTILGGIASRGGQVHCAAVLAQLAEIGVDEDLLADNPVRRLRLKGYIPRSQIWSVEDEQRFAAACAQVPNGRGVRLGLAVLLYTGQRPGDVRAMQWRQYRGGTVRVRQQKTRKLVEVACHAELRRVLAVARPGRGRAIDSLHIVTDDAGRPFTVRSWEHAFNQVRALAGLRHLQARDLRRTACVRLAEAGATVPEIAALTGHSIERTTTILETYLPRTVAMSRSGVRKWERATAARLGTDRQRKSNV